MTRPSIRPKPRPPAKDNASAAASSSSAQDKEADDALLSDLLNAGKRFRKGKLRQVDPRRVRRSRFANRAMEEVGSPQFQMLADLVRQSGTNLVPAVVDELAASDCSDSHDFELVYGHRRHQVCLAEGLLLTVIVVPPLDNVERAFLMSNENEGRVAPCPLDMGLWLSTLLESGRFASQAALARTTSIKPASVTNLLKLARLPQEVIAAFSDRSELAHRHALPLEQAASDDLAGLVHRAKAIAALRASTSVRIGKQRVFGMLVGSISIDATALEAAASRSSVSTVDTGEEPSLHASEVNSNHISQGDSVDASVMPSVDEAQARTQVEDYDGAEDKPVEPASPRQNVQRLNRALPLVTDCGNEPGQVFTNDEGDTFIRLPFALDERDLDWFAENLGKLMNDAPFLHKIRRGEEGEEAHHG